MNRLNSVKKSLDEALHKDNYVTHILEKAEQKTKVDRSYIAMGLIVFFVLYLIFGYGTVFLSNLIGFCYPAYRSIKALETHDKDDDTKWLTYWVVFALFSVVESLTDILFYWVPLYSLLKCSLYVFMMIPGTPNGSVLIYEKIIRPHILAHQKAIDSAIDDAADLAGQFGKAVKSGAADFTKQLAGKDL